MTYKLYCGKCEVFVASPVKGEFEHPDHGKMSCNVCPTCKEMVFLKGDERTPV